MEIIYRMGQASANDVQEALPAPPASYSAVRALLRILEVKGHVRHVREGSRYVYLPIHPRKNAARSALEQVVQTFFGGSIEQAVTTLVSDADTRLTEEELDRLAALIEQAKEEGR